MAPSSKMAGSVWPLKTVARQTACTGSSSTGVAVKPTMMGSASGCLPAAKSRSPT